MTPTKLLVLDPLTLVGKEFLGCIAASDSLSAEIAFRHTDADEEHQITEFGGNPVLVPPLDSPDDLVGFDAVVVASDAQGSRHDHLLAFADADPSAALLDLSRLACLRDRTTASAGDTSERSRQLRVAHPALVAAARVFEVLAPFGRTAGTLAVVDPVSVHGQAAIELLALQSAQRLQGGTPSERIYGHVRAFNVLAMDPSELQEEAARVLPELPLAVTLSLSGMFHGHLAHLGLVFPEALEPDMVREALEQAEGVEVRELPLGLDSIADNDRVLVAPASLSADGRLLALTMMADGLRVGGALTAVEILEGLV